MDKEEVFKRINQTTKELREFAGTKFRPGGSKRDMYQEVLANIRRFLDNFSGNSPEIIL